MYHTLFVYDAMVMLYMGVFLLIYEVSMVARFLMFKDTTI